MKIFLLMLFLFLIGPVQACTCFEIESARELMDEFEFVIIGRAVKNVGHNGEVNRMWDEGNRGFDVLFEVDSVVKGDIDVKTLYIKQFDGNCDRIFEFGEKYLILGEEIESFTSETQSEKNLKNGEIPNDLMPPPPPSFRSKNVTFFDGDQTRVDFWNDVAKDSFILNTSSCSSFLIDSKTGSYFLSN